MKEFFCYNQIRQVSPEWTGVCRKQAIGFEAEDENLQETEAASYFFTGPNAGCEEG